MENVLARYKRPIKSIADPKVDVSYWEDAIDFFEEKEFKKSVVATLNYINPNLLKDKDISNDFEIIQMQGSAEIHVQVTNSTFKVRSPFLKITDKTNRIALLRKIAEVNFSPLTLVQIVLNENELWFEYKMPLSVCQPNKVYDVLREVFVNADRLDDEFIENYKASFYKEPKITPLSSSEQEEVWSQISNIFEDYINYTQFFKDKRWTAYQWDIIVISLLKLSNMPYIQGVLRSDLIEKIDLLFNGDIDFNHRVNKGVNYMKDLVKTSKETIMKDVYHSEQFISLRWRSSEQIVKDRLTYNLKQVEKYEKEESYFNLSYYLQFILLKLIFDYNLEDSYKKAIEDVLEDVAGLNPVDAAPKLVKVYYALQTGTINKNEEKKEKKGFFSKLFN